jgi:NitT/TauT family transport system ATP-binding protein
LLKWRTILDNVLLPAEIVGLPMKAARARARDLLNLVGLAGYEDKYPQQLSGGMQQRTAIARAFIHDPKLILMDEPFGALDALIRDDLASDYRAIHDRLGLTTILVTHDMTEAFLLADRVAVMRNGELLQVATPKELVAAPANEFVRAMIDIPRQRAKKLADAMQAT